MNKNCFHTVSGVVFGLVALLHLTRVIFGVNFQIGSWFVPEWVSLAGFVGAGFLSFWAFRSLEK